MYAYECIYDPYMFVGRHVQTYTYYIHEFIHEFAYIHMYVGRHTWAYVCMYINTHITDIHMNICIYTCIYMYALHVYIYVYMDIHTYMHIYIHVYVCIYVSHSGVLRTIKSLVHALGTSSSMTEPTINPTLLTFIEQVNIYALQKMVLQFAIHFVPTVGYTYMVYTLNN